jgi:hypothetical protein
MCNHFARATICTCGHAPQPTAEQPSRAELLQRIAALEEENSNLLESKERSDDLAAHRLASFRTPCPPLPCPALPYPTLPYKKHSDEIAAHRLESFRNI